MKRLPLLFLALFLSGCGRSSTPTPVYIGHVGELSGADRVADEHAALGMRLALMDKELAQVDGHPLQVRHTDTRGQIEAYEAQGVRLVAVSKVAALYGGDSAAEVLRLDKSRVPLLSPLGFRPAGVSDQAFALGLSPSFQGKVLASFAADRLSLISLLSLSPTPHALFVESRPAPSALVLKAEPSDEADQVAAAFIKTWNEIWGKRVEGTPAPTVLAFTKESKWDELTKKALESRPDCIVFAGATADFRTFLSHLPAAAALFVYSGGDGTLSVAAAPLLLYAGSDGPLAHVPAGKTVYRASAFAADAKETAVKDFVAKFRETFKSDPDVHAALAYDGIRVLATALKNAHANTTSLPTELRAIRDFAGLTGPLSFSSDQAAKRPAYVLRCEVDRASAEKRHEP